MRPGGRALGTGFTAPQVPRAARPCMCCCCRCCSAARCSGALGAAGDTDPRGRPEHRTWLLACGPCWLCLMSLGPIGIAIKALRGGTAVAVAGFHQLSALLECSAALLARLRAQPALLEGFVTLLALPA